MENFNQQPQDGRQLLGVCTVCGAAIYAEAELGERTPRVKCRRCVDRLAAEQRRNEQAKQKEKKRSIAQAKAAARKTLIIPAVVFAVIACIVCVLDSRYIWQTILGTVLLYLTTVQLLWAADPVASVMFFFLRAPKFTFGLIFELSIEGILWLIIVKLALWILGIVLSVLMFLLGLVISAALSVFAFPFHLVRAIRSPEEIEFLL